MLGGRARVGIGPLGDRNRSESMVSGLRIAVRMGDLPTPWALSAHREGVRRENDMDAGLVGTGSRHDGLAALPRAHPQSVPPSGDA